MDRTAASKSRTASRIFSRSADSASRAVWLYQRSSGQRSARARQRTRSETHGARRRTASAEKSTAAAEAMLQGSRVLDGRWKRNVGHSELTRAEKPESGVDRVAMQPTSYVDAVGADAERGPSGKPN